MEQKDLQAIADLTANLYRQRGYRAATLPPIKLHKVNTGHAHATYISIPTWAVEQGEAYATYYVVHEVTHYFISWHLHKHGPAFKSLECIGLEAWGLFPIYSRAYAKELRNAAGDTLFKRAWR